MIRDITIGQYYPADSFVHRLDPRVKLFSTLIYIIALFSFRGILGFAVITVFLACMIRLSKVPLCYMMRGLKAIMVLIAVTAFFNIMLTPGEHVFWHYWRFQITDQGIENAAIMVVRIVYLILGTSLMTLTTTPNQLTDGLETSLKPLNRLHIPVHEVAMMMSIALRFIPILTEEADKIMKAQMARGADFEKGNLIQRARNMVPLLVPLFVSAFRRADDLALAMEARCYHGGEGRTRMKPLSYGREDRAAYGVILLFLAVVLAMRF